MISFRSAKVLSAAVLGLLALSPCLRATSLVLTDTPTSLSVTWDYGSSWYANNWQSGGYGGGGDVTQFYGAAAVRPVGGAFEILVTPSAVFGSEAVFDGTFINGLYTDTYHLGVTKLSSTDLAHYSLQGSHVLTTSIGVPDAGSTLVLCGIALLGIIAARRKF